MPSFLILVLILFLHTLNSLDIFLIFMGVIYSSSYYKSLNSWVYLPFFFWVVLRVVVTTVLYFKFKLLLRPATQASIRVKVSPLLFFCVLMFTVVIWVVPDCRCLYKFVI